MMSPGSFVLYTKELVKLTPAAFEKSNFSELKLSFEVEEEEQQKSMTRMTRKFLDMMQK